MSGDVQPRKRKDKKKKKDDLGVEEPRGTAAAFGEGDVFMHSHSEHGTGGHWCAKVIFFSLLAVLITLIGLIILENRGLTELEANSVESKYSGVLEGWIEDAPDDHHDEHTLELKHHDEDDGDQGSEIDHDDDDDEHDEENDDDEDENDDDDDEHEDENDDDNDTENDEDETEQAADDSEEADNENDDDDDENQKSEEQNVDTAEEDEDDVEEPISYRKYYGSNDKGNDDEDDDDDDDLQKESDEHDYETDNDRNDDIDDDAQQQDNDEDQETDQGNDDFENHQDFESLEEKDKETEEDKTLENDDDDSKEASDYLQNDAARDNEDEEEHEEQEEPANIEVEAIEREVSDDDAVSAEDPAATDENEDQSQEESEELPPEDISEEDDDVEFLEPDELDELPIVEPITAPKGKPLAEVGESLSTEKPQDTLADEEEYERQQDELRKEREQASQGMWLKLTVGCALLVATHAVLRRATAARETDTEDDPDFSREETPLSDRRMTLISDPVPPPSAPNVPEISRPIQREIKKESTVIVRSSPQFKEESEEEEEIIVTKPIQPAVTPKDTVDRELYSDEEEDEDVENEEEEIIEPTKAIPQQQAVPQVPQTMPDVTKEVTPEPDEDDDVEIIDEEHFEEELEEEEISDVDDAELLSRLEAKYGRLPEPERPGRTHKDGGNSIEDEWPGEPADAFWSEHLEQAQRELRQGEWTAAVEKASAPALAGSARARHVVARALDAAADAKKDNQLLNRAIAAYLELLKMNERLSNKKLLEVATRTLDRIKFRGTYLSAEPVYKMLIRRFPDDPTYRNNLTISLLMANRADLAENVLKETLKLWPKDRVALAHHGFILKTLHNRLEDAVEAFSTALEGDAGAANEPRFYYHLGDALLQLGRFKQAHEVHKRGAELGHFLSPSQRSLYNVDRLKSKPWWNIDQTPYSRLARSLEKSWKEILKEGEAAKAIYEKEKEGLKERGEWSQLDLFVRGREVPNRCSRAPVTCGVVKAELAASGCRRGQIKFSLMAAGTHVRPHVGPTNCRLRMHLGLSNTKDTYIRVDRETRSWQTGKVLMFDDSFEHEVWHNGTGARLVLIVDVWHPDLSPAERRQLPAI